MNNIYVDELPKDCLDCPCRDGEFNKCNLIHCEHSVGYFDEDELDYKYIPINQDFEKLICPLKPLSVALAEERKRVVQKIRDKLRTCDEYDCCCLEDMNMDEVNKFLDQIERGDV